METLTIDQVAQMLKVSKQTIRRRIKSGEYQAELMPGAYGKEYRLPASQFDTAIEIKDVVPVTRQVSVPELEQAIQKMISEAIHEAVTRETSLLREDIQKLHNKIDKLSQQQPGKKSFWQRLFNIGG